MTRAADLLDALLARRWARRASRIPAPRPRGWAASDVHVARELAPWWPVRGRGHEAPRRPSPGFLQAVRQLAWQHWDPAPRDERPLRWSAALTSALIHLLFLLLMIWAALHRMPRETEAGEEGRVRMSFVGRGTPGGGAGAPGDAPAVPASPAARTSPASPRRATATAATARPAPMPSPATPPPAAAPPVPPVLVTVPPSPSPLQATETPVPTTDFVVPPPVVATRALTPPTLQVRERPVEVVSERPPVTAVAPAPRVPALRAAPTVAVREREIVLPDRPQVPLASPRPREPEPALRMPEIEVAQAELPSPVSSPSPSPSPSPAPTQTPAQAATPAAEAAPSPATASRAPAAAGTATQPPGNRAAGVAAGAPATDRSGGWDAVRRDDDWGAAPRRQEGHREAGSGRRGLYNADGSARVPGAPGEGTAARGAPGGDSDSWTRDRLAQSGTWLKRPPYDYAPTSLDRYWIPNESLLQEWVRRGLKQIEIPIPGTTTRITCVVSLLQFGGGCGLSDPNMNEQPAQARPPPDIPFKRELQEDNGSVR